MFRQLAFFLFIFCSQLRYLLCPGIINIDQGQSSIPKPGHGIDLTIFFKRPMGTAFKAMCKIEQVVEIFDKENSSNEERVMIASGIARDIIPG